MNLVIDCGNTFIKIYIYSNDKSIHYENVRTNLLDEVFIINLFKSFKNINNCIISESIILKKEVLKTIENQNIKPLIDIYSLNLPLIINYNNNDKLGIDRIAGAVAAKKIFPNNPVLIIDAGTAITYDIVDEKNCFLGGAISPGIALRFKSLHNNSSRLPLVNIKNIIPYNANSTNDCILSGVINGLLFEINGWITHYSKNYDNLRIILTGGDCNYLHNKIKTTIFAEPNLIANGLNVILEINK